MEDENIVQAARNLCPTKRMVIFDARSMLAAGGNRLKVRHKVLKVSEKIWYIQCVCTGVCVYLYMF